MENNFGRTSAGRAGRWLLGLAVIGGLGGGGYWLWENRYDDVVAWKERGTEWVSSLASKAKGWLASVSLPSDAEKGAGTEFPGTKGDAWWKKGENWTRTKAANFDSLSDADNELILSWDERKPEIARILETVRETVAQITSAPAYSYDRKALARVQEDVEIMTRCLEIGDPLRLDDRQPSMENHVRAFMSGVHWRVGIPHPTAPHVHSGAKENSWEPDDGYVWSSPAQGDGNLAVSYRGHAHRCGRCNGTGTIIEPASCPKCQGKGRIPNPVVQAGNTISHAANTVNQVLSIFTGEPPPPAQQVDDPGIRCNQCNGHGTVRLEQACPDCENGTVWR